MRAVLVEAVGAPAVMQLRTGFPVPTPGRGQVLVKNSFIGVNYIDTYQRKGMYPMPVPFVPGQEGAGTIVAVGEGVSDFSIGQRVAYLSFASYAEMTLAPATQTLLLPDAISFESAAASLLQGMTATYLVHLSHSVQQGEWVLVPAAAGGVGSWICRLAVRKGGRVIAIVGSPEKVDVVKGLGAEHVLNHRTDDLEARVMEITQGRGVNVVYDGIGQALYRTFLRCMGRFGSYIYFGNASGKIENFNPFDLTPKCLRFMRPSLHGYCETREGFMQLADILLPVVCEEPKAVLVHKIFDLSQVAEAHEDLESGKTIGKLLLRVD